MNNPLVRKIRPTVLQPQGRHRINLTHPDYRKAANRLHTWFVTEWLSLFLTVVAVLAWGSTDDEYWVTVWAVTIVASLVMAAYSQRRWFYWHEQIRPDRWKDATPR